MQWGFITQLVVSQPRRPGYKSFKVSRLNGKIGNIPISKVSSQLFFLFLSGKNAVLLFCG